MPRQPRIPSYRLHKPTGQAVVTLAGRDIYLGKHDTQASREAYERTVIALKAHGHVPRPKTQLPLSIASLIANYWQHIEAEGLYIKNGRPTSERSCIAVALRPVVRLFGSLPASDFGPKNLKLVRNALCEPLPPPVGDQRRRRVHTGPIARTSVNKHVHRIRHVFRWAVSEELVPSSMWESLRSLEPLKRGAARVREPAPIAPANLRHVVAVLRIAPTDIAAMIRLQYLTGARPGEVVIMRMRDIDRTRSVWVFRPSFHKVEHHGVNRQFGLGPKAQELLAPLLQLDPDAWLFPGRKRYLTENAYCKIIGRLCDKAGVPRWQPGQLRHNNATWVRRRHGIEASQLVLGHTNMQTTEIYAEKNWGLVEQVMLAHG
jgi:integrase